MTDLQKRIYGAFRPADLLLPPRGADMTKWCSIACDQYTSEPEYWRGFDEFIGEAPSSRRCILPEAYLSASGSREIGKINRTMRDYLYNYLVSCGNSMIYVERTISGGGKRRGIVGAVDLEEYDFSPDSSSLIRPTELTVPERIPPRLRVRYEAPLEMSHVLLLIDDESDELIMNAQHEPRPLYDFDLYGGAGHLTGYLMGEDSVEAFRRSLAKGLANDSSFAFAVGDGNHSLASAKVSWERIKSLIPKEMYDTHPARYAMVELTNLHDKTLEFEPIFRVIKGVNPEAVYESFCSFASALHGSCASQDITLLFGDKTRNVRIPAPENALPVGTVQRFINESLNLLGEGAGVDYIHGLDTVKRLSRDDNTTAFVFEGMRKDELFGAVASDGSLPRKTFSMGHANDKRFYCEAKRIMTDGELTV